MADHSKRRLLRALGLAPLSLAGSSTWAAAGTPPGTVLLKLDDVLELRQRGLSDAWKRVRDFISREGLAASWGIIGESLEDPSDRYVEEMRAIARDPRFEIWNHGYVIRFLPNTAAAETAANVGPGADAQFDAIDRTQKLVASRLGVTPRIFGPHASATDDNTYLALARIPDIRAVWFYGPRKPDATRAYIFKREGNLEHPIFVPKLSGLQAELATRPVTQPYLALQGHPDMWNEERFQAFVEVVRWLTNQGCKFMCASEYLQTVR